MKRHLQLGTRQLAAGFADGSFSPVKVVDHALDAAVKLKTLNAFMRLTPELTLHQAKKAQHRYGHEQQLGALDGVPIAIKDNFCTKDDHLSF